MRLLRLHISLILFFFAGCSSLPAPDTTALKYTPPPAEQWELPNGLKVLYLQDAELPLVSASLFVRGGTLWATGREKLAAETMGSQLRVGGTKKLSPSQLDFQLEKLAASISSSLGGEYGTISFQCLEQDLPRVFSLFSDVVLEPRFDEARLDLWRAASLDGIKRRKDDGSTIASLALSELLLGATPYGFIPTSKDVRSIQRVDLLRAHRKFIRPNGAIMVVAGSADKVTVKELINKHLLKWEARTKELPALPEITKQPEPAMVFIEMPVANQSSVYLGTLGVKRHTPDTYAITTFNELFGSGGFDSRLMRRVRTELGLAYSVYGGTRPGRVAGRNIIAMQTKSDSTFVALKESLEQLAILQRELVSDKELETVKQASENAFVFKYNSPKKLLNRKALLSLLEYPEDYDENYLSHLFAVTKQDVKDVATNRWHLDRFVIVVVGDKNAYTLLEEGMKSPPELLKGYTLQRRSFDERLLPK